jgi:hypothetical protein
LKFFQFPLNICDIISVVPYYFFIAFYTHSFMISFKNIARVVRLLSLIRVLRRWSGFNTMLITLRQSINEIAMFLIFLSLNVLVFSVVIFYCEYLQTDTAFISIPATFW